MGGPSGRRRRKESVDGRRRRAGAGKDNNETVADGGDEIGGGDSASQGRVSPPWVWGCLIVSRQGKCLVHCLPRKPAGVRLHIRQLGNMLLAVQNLAGRGRTCSLTLNHYAVGLAGRRHFVVALLAPPASRGKSLELRAEQIAHSFQFYHGAQLAEVSGAEEAEAERRLSTYTVHDVVSEASEEGAPSARDLMLPSSTRSELSATTLPPYADFEALYLGQILRAPKYSRMWLSTLASVPGVRHVALVGVREGGEAYEMLQDEGLSYRPPDSPDSAQMRVAKGSAVPSQANVADVAGPGGGLVWETALAGCAHLAAGRRHAAATRAEHHRRSSGGGALPGYLTLSLSELRPPLMVFIAALSLPVPPHEACVAVFFQVNAHQRDADVHFEPECVRRRCDTFAFDTTGFVVKAIDDGLKPFHPPSSN